MIWPPAASSKRTFMHTSLLTGSDERTSDARPWSEGRIVQGVLLVFAAVLPFETPLCRVGPLQLTTAELGLYAMLFSWGAATALDISGARHSLRARLLALRDDGAARAAAFYAFIVFVSAAVAPTDRGASLKFALRTLSGVLAFFAVRSLARSPEATRRLVVAIAAGALVSGATAVLESLVPETASVWSIFRAGTFETLGLERASGVFAYPTIGAMYWEAAVPLVVVAPFLGWRGLFGASHPPGQPSATPGRPRGAALLALLANALLVGAILASATRSGLVGAAFACGILAALGKPFRPWVPRVAMGSLGVLLASLVVAVHGGDPASRLGQRLRFWNDRSWLRAELHVGSAPDTLRAGEVFEVSVAVRNTGTLAWRRDGAKPTRVAYHWVPLHGPVTIADFEGQRTALPEDVPPGGSLDVVARARAPADEGTYRLRWDLVQEDVAWFSDEGNVMPERMVEVVERGAGEKIAETRGEALLPSKPPPPLRSELWRAAVVLWRQRPLLGIGPDNFRRRYEAVLSPAANGQPYTDTRMHANSVYFETLADLGLAGVFALSWVLVALVRLLGRHFAEGRLAGFGCGVSALVFFVHGGLDYFFEFTPLFGLFWVLLGMTSAAREPERPTGEARGDSPR
jgi:hypothetical protein